MPPPIFGILLAAGGGTRFGEDKLLHRLADGSHMAVTAARRLVQGVDQALAVVRPGDDRLPPMLQAVGLRVETNERAADGMGSSLARGVASSRDAGGWVVALADMPFIRAETIAAVARALAEGAPIAVPAHGGYRGHPVGFARTFRRELERLSGDRGARALLGRHADLVSVVQVRDPGILIDVDRPRDLAGRG